jgi:hypothetical protein
MIGNFVDQPSGDISDITILVKHSVVNEPVDGFFS